ncbi:MAG TPA: nucleotidyltransferase domain-containing protein [Acetobacteraceae bacterium]
MKPSEALAAHRDELRELVGRHGLARPRVYGSVLSRADTDESDLDLLVEATARTTLFTLVRLERAAQELLGVRVSILTPGFLPEKFRDRVLAQAEPPLPMKAPAHADDRGRRPRRTQPPKP